MFIQDRVFKTPYNVSYIKFKCSPNNMSCFMEGKGNIKGDIPVVLQVFGIILKQGDIGWQVDTFTVCIGKIFLVIRVTGVIPDCRNQYTCSI